MVNPYAGEKFNNAVYGMAASPQSIQSRVADAYTSNVMLLNEEDLPESIRLRFREFGETITAVEPAGEEGSVKATMNQMSDEDAAEMAREILMMADAVRTALAEQNE